MLVALMAVMLTVLVRSVTNCIVKQNVTEEGDFHFVCLCVIDNVFIPFSVLVVPLMGRATRVKLKGHTNIVLLCLMFCVPVGILLCDKCLGGVPRTLRRTTSVSKTDA